MKVQPKLTFKNQYSLFHEVEKIDESNWRTVNANFQFSFCEIEKKTEVSLKTHIQNLNFEFKDELKNNMSQFEFHC